jgi:uncharacterized protein YkwD
MYALSGRVSDRVTSKVPGPPLLVGVPTQPIAGVQPVEVVEPLTRSSSVKAGWIRACSSFSHTPCGHTFLSAFHLVHYDESAWSIGENLAWGASGRGRVRAIFRAWLRSSSHRSNIVRPKWRDLGLTMTRSRRLFGARDVVLWVVHFGRHGAIASAAQRSQVGGAVRSSARRM